MGDHFTDSPRAIRDTFDYHFFLSFSGNDADLATRAYDLLIAEGYKVYFQFSDFEPGRSIFGQINRALDSSEKVIALFTPNYLATSVHTEVEFYAAFREAKLLIFRFDNASIPTVAADQIRIDFPDGFYSALSLKLLQTAALLKPVRFTPSAIRIYLSKNMPGWKGAGGHANLIGRDQELARVTDAFHNESCSVACVIADGGYGKSALVQRWLADLQGQGYLGIQAGFAYSFYKQGWEAGSAMTSAPFFSECLATLSGRKETDLPGDEEVHAKEIISLLQTRRTLLVLDGLEPHQQPRGTKNEGHINSPTLRWFLRELKQHVHMRNGLCIVTSRIMAPELEPDSLWQSTMQIPVGALSHDTSVKALKQAGLNESNPDIDEWARQSQGHPLLIALLAPAIETAHYDPSMFHVDRVLNDGQTSIPDAVQRVAVWHLDQLGEEAHSVLNSILLFDGSVTYDELRDLLIDKASIPHFTDALRIRTGITKRCSHAAFERGAILLKKAAMITLNADEHDTSSWKLEVHPLVQAGVRRDLVARFRSAWRKANMRVYLSIARSVMKSQPDDVPSLRIIYSAVPHGVRAGRGKRAGWMYARRCLRFFKGYSTAKGMIADDVALLANYFEGNWKTVREDIGLDRFATTQAKVWAGLLLNGVNRSFDGMRLIEEGLKDAKRYRYYTTAARMARYLGFVYALRGNPQKGEDFIREAIVNLEKRSPLHIQAMDAILVKYDFQRMACRVMLASVLHQQGLFEEAEGFFLEAEEITRKATGFSTLRNIWCFRRVAHLCDAERFDEARTLLAEASIRPGEPAGWGEGVFVEPVLKLGKICCAIRDADLRGTIPDEAVMQQASTALKDMEEDQGFRMDWLLPAAKIAVAGRHRLAGRPEIAALPLAEAEALIEKSGNCLFRVDLLMERARIHLATSRTDLAEESIVEAVAFAERIGYRARMGEMTKIRNLCSGATV